MLIPQDEKHFSILTHISVSQEIHMLLAGWPAEHGGDRISPAGEWHTQRIYIIYEEYTVNYGREKVEYDR